VLAVTVVLTALQFPFPQVRLDLWRAPGSLAAGQWWRLVSALGVQYDPVWQIVVVLACVAGVVLTVAGDQHGPPLLVGFALGLLWLWLDRRRALAVPPS
jgi:hypothetical protein